MPPAAEQNQRPGNAAGDRRADGRARQAPARRRRRPQAHRPGARRHPDAGARRAVRRQDLQHARRRRAARNLDRDVLARRHRIERGRKTAARIRLAAVGVGRAARQPRRHRAPAAAIPAARARARHHGRYPRPRRPQHVGEARQRAGRGAGDLSQERIPADGGGGAVQAAIRTRRPRARHPARGPRARRGQPHAADGVGAEGGDRARRADAAHRIHVQPVADPPARRPRGDGRNLQQFRPPDRNPLPLRAGNAKAATPPSASRR